MTRVLAEKGNLILVDFGGHDPLLSKKQLSRHPEIRRSTRWIEQRVAEGMPSQLDGNRRMFRLSGVRAWLKDWKPPTGSHQAVEESASSASKPAAQPAKAEDAQPGASVDEAAPPPPNAA